MLNKSCSKSFRRRKNVWIRILEFIGLSMMTSCSSLKMDHRPRMISLSLESVSMLQTWIFQQDITKRLAFKKVPRRKVSSLSKIIHTSILFLTKLNQLTVEKPLVVSPFLALTKMFKKYSMKAVQTSSILQ